MGHPHENYTRHKPSLLETATFPKPGWFEHKRGQFPYKSHGHELFPDWLEGRFRPPLFNQPLAMVRPNVRTALAQRGVRTLNDLLGLRPEHDTGKKKPLIVDHKTIKVATGEAERILAAVQTVPHLRLLYQILPDHLHRRTTPLSADEEAVVVGAVEETVDAFFPDGIVKDVLADLYGFTTGFRRKPQEIARDGMTVEEIVATEQAALFEMRQEISLTPELTALFHPSALE